MNMDQSDLHDWEIQMISQIWMALQQRWSHRPNTRQNLSEFAKVATEVFIRQGFVVNVMWENALIMVATKTGEIEPLPITIEIMGRVENPVHGFDHERKRHEVLLSRDRNENFLGQKEGKVIK